MDKNNNYNRHCHCCGRECNDNVIRGEDHTAYCTKECMLADRLCWRIQIISKVLSSKEK